MAKQKHLIDLNKELKGELCDTLSIAATLTLTNWLSSRKEKLTEDEWLELISGVSICVVTRKEAANEEAILYPTR
jgi:hypothetical protein